MHRCRHVPAFRAGERVAVEAQTICAHEGRAEAGAGHEHQHGGFSRAAREPRFGHAAVVAVVADDER